MHFCGLTFEIDPFVARWSMVVHRNLQTKNVLHACGQRRRVSYHKRYVWVPYKGGSVCEPSSTYLPPRRRWSCRSSCWDSRPRSSPSSRTGTSVLEDPGDSENGPRCVVSPRRGEETEGKSLLEDEPTTLDSTRQHDDGRITHVANNTYTGLRHNSRGHNLASPPRFPRKDQ